MKFLKLPNGSLVARDAVVSIRAFSEIPKTGEYAWQQSMRAKVIVDYVCGRNGLSILLECPDNNSAAQLESDLIKQMEEAE